MSNIPEGIVVLLNEIAERLWSGHASVMVGAGFSKNATRNSANSKPFLAWNQLADIFFEKLHGRLPTEKENYLNPLKLAEEVCAAFGRPALEKLMQTVLPDLDYSPSDTHKDLLELPWNDVFTTNYDTLLERTKISQRYDIVLSKSDLVFSQRPRIIKLHGSFSSHRPFIITEEDYRKFPREYAPLVNTVQQSLIENTLCLIGFSGDDPNFLSWIGWIRDNLGSSSSPRIFLIGVLDLKPSQIKVLEQRNIGVIDLSLCVANELEKHKKALQIFIEFLKSKKADENRLDWPNEKGARFSPSQDTSDKEYISEIKLLTDNWKKTREEYPGWVICPRDSRKILWSHTHNWLYGRHLKITAPFGIDISFWREFVWRLDRSLSPLYDDIAPVVESVIARYNPFPKILALQAEFRHMKDSDQFVWSTIKEAWIYLNFALLRFYREEGLPDKWAAISNMLEACLDEISSAQKDNLRYEQCLFHLFRQEIVKFRAVLQSWKPDDSSPFYQSKKAGLLAEYGDINESQTLLENALQLVRSQLNLRPITTDYTHLSQEAYILQLLKFVKDAKSSFLIGENDSQKYIEEFTLRWTKLKQYKCDPWGELQLFEAKLSGSIKEQKRQKTEYGFDIGHRSTNHYIGTDEDALEAYAFLRHMDDIGIPYHIRNMSLGRDSAKGAIERVAKLSLNWATATLLRTGDSKSVDILFSRPFLAKESLEKIEALVDVLLKLLEDLAEDIERVDHWKNSNMGTHYASIVPEVVSRLCTRCSFDKLNKILDFLLIIYKSPHKQKYSNIDHLTKRLVASWPIEHLPELISRIISEFPIVTGVHRQLQSDFPDPLDFVDREVPIDNKEKILVPVEVLNKLLTDFENASDGNKEAILDRLIKVIRYGLLSTEQNDQFGDALWRKVDDSGFPADFKKIFRWFFLELPHPSSADVEKLLHIYLQNLKFSVIGQSKSISITGGQCSSCSEVLAASKVLNRIGWTPDDAINLLKKIMDWWSIDKHFLSETNRTSLSERSKEFKGRFQNAIHTLEVAVIPFLSDQTLRGNAEGLEKFINEIASLGMSAIELKMAVFLRGPNDFGKIFANISSDILSDDFFRTIRAIIVVTRLLDPKLVVLKEVDRESILALVVGVVKWRKATALIPALANLNVILQYPAIQLKHYRDDVFIGLQHIAAESELSYENSPIPLHDRLFVRKEAAALAHTLYSAAFVKGEAVHPSLEIWKAICHDPREFAEIRNQWTDY